MRNFLAGLIFLIGVLLTIVFGVDIFTRQIAEPFFTITFLLAQLCFGIFGVLQGKVRLAVSMGVFLLIELVIIIFIPESWFVAYF